jgi:hypothetical protein
MGTVFSGLLLQPTSDVLEVHASGTPLSFRDFRHLDQECGTSPNISNGVLEERRQCRPRASLGRSLVDVTYMTN